MRILLSFIIISLQITPTLANGSLITKETYYVKGEPFYSYTCANEADFRGQPVALSHIFWNTKNHPMYLSCCYHLIGRHYCPPEGQIYLKGVVIPSTCQYDPHKGLRGCQPVNPNSQLDKE